MSTTRNNISGCLSTTYPEEHSPIKPKRQRTLRRDLSKNEPREFRHITRLNSEVSGVSFERQQSLQIQEYYQDIIDDIHQYFSGVNSPYLQTSIKLPKVGITRRLTKDDITHPIHFRHIAHINYRQVSKSLEDMSDITRKSSLGSRSMDFDFPINRTKQSLSKDDISEPTDFRHIAHVGFDDHNLKVNTEDATIKFALEKSGPSNEMKNSSRNLASLLRNNKENENANTERKVITKEDIGNPKNFQHIAHIGLDSTSKISEKTFIKNVDVKNKEIQNYISEIKENTQPVPVFKPIPKPRTIRKADIEKPQDFRHNAHISHNKDKSENDDLILQHFFKKAGVTEEHLMNKETREFIFDFIQRYSKREDGRNNQQKAIPNDHKKLARQLQNEADQRTQEEYSELLLALYRRHFPI